MNKKGTILMLLFFLMMVFFGIIIFQIVFINSNSFDDACKDIGYDKRISKGLSRNFCINKTGENIEVFFECDYRFYNSKCKAYKING